jgi:predicted AAA+ superfamily ATPase
MNSIQYVNDIFGTLAGLMVLDEIQLLPELFNVFRVLVVRPASAAHFLLRGSVSPHIVKSVSETMAGRVEDAVKNRRVQIQ